MGLLQKVALRANLCDVFLRITIQIAKRLRIGGSGAVIIALKRSTSATQYLATKGFYNILCFSDGRGAPANT